ncbi:MAG TPA: NifU family protein [Bacteroidia bacterium]|nr:NifU family protein [Bacteroidia bacterium]
METVIPYTIYIEATPNPASMKFVANKVLITERGASAEYKDVSETLTAPIAKQLFQFPFVKTVFISANFITITKTDAVEWDDITVELRVFLTEYLNAGNLIVTALPKQEVAVDNTFTEKTVISTQHVAAKDEVEAKIIEVLDQYVRPAVEQDGGLITFKELKDGIVTVQMRGACSGCPSSTMTLKAGIEALLKRLLPDAVKEVVSEAV